MSQVLNTSISGLRPGWLRRRLLTLALASALAWAMPSLADAEVRLIVHADVPVDSISQNTARRIFFKHYKRWPDGNRVTVFVLGDRHPAHVEMTKKLLGLYPQKLRKLIQRQVFTGTGQAPLEVESIKEMLERVRETPGGIGYVMDEVLHEQIKILEVH